MLIQFQAFVKMYNIILIYLYYNILITYLSLSFMYSSTDGDIIITLRAMKQTQLDKKNKQLLKQSKL